MGRRCRSGFGGGSAGTETAGAVGRAGGRRFFVDGLIILSVVYYLLGGIAIGLGIHRLLAHRALRLPKWLEYTIVTISLPAGTPIQWVGNHRFHHAHTDEPKDPHSPTISGFWYAHVGWYLQTNNTALCILYSLAGPLRMVFDGLWRPRTNQQFNDLARDVSSDRYYAWVSRPASYMAMLWLQAAAVFGLAYYLAGWFGFAAMWAELAFMYNACDAVDSVTHLWGTQPYKIRDNARNNACLAFLTLGEGWHANHHSFPSSARHGLLRRQFDWTWETIRFLRWIGLATEVKLPSRRLIAAKIEDRYE
jgi:fatty-acid desaturase